MECNFGSQVVDYNATVDLDTEPRSKIEYPEFDVEVLPDVPMDANEKKIVKNFYNY